jgi:hypothetical protein
VHTIHEEPMGERQQAIAAKRAAAGWGAVSSGTMIWGLMWVDLDPVLQLGVGVFLAAACALFGLIWGELVPLERKIATRRRGA